VQTVVAIIKVTLIKDSAINRFFDAIPCVASLHLLVKVVCWGPERVIGWISKF